MACLKFFWLELWTNSVGCLCVSVRGWQRGIEYVYEYNGRLVTSVWDMKQQFATVEMLASLHVQSVDNSTLIMKLSDVKIRRQGNCQGNPYYETNDGANDQISLPIEIGGDDVQIIDIDKLQTPFEVKHLLGSVSYVTGVGCVVCSRKFFDFVR